MDEKAVYILKRLYEQDFVSGENLARELDVSRMAINKRIKSLQEMGFSITGCRKRGYQLVDKDIIRIWEIENFVSKSNLFEDFLFFDQINSTNSYIKENQEKLKSATVVYAERQTAGRGRLGRSWIDLEKGIKMSIFLSIDFIDIEKLVPLTLFTGLVVNRVLRTFKVNSFIKWSNDILINGKKVCGILTELLGELDGRGNVIIGIGLNVNATNLPEDILEIATTLKKEMGVSFDRTDIIIGILKEFEKEFENFKTRGFLPFRDEYKSYCANLEREIIINGEQKAFCKDIGQNGELICEQNGKELKIHSGEVTVRW